MSKLHELLAVDGNLKSAATKATADLLNTFEKKRHHFSQRKVVFKPRDEAGVEKVEEQLDLQTTVGKELDWIGDFIHRAIDIGYQIAMANTVAAADVVLDNGQVLLSHMPATALLELEKKMAEVHALVLAIPTLDPAKGFQLDPQQGEGIYHAREEHKSRTKKQQRVLVKYEATKEHPAQTELITEDVPVGELVTNEWSALITTADKGKMIERCDEVLRAIKQARSRANDHEIDTKAPGARIGAKALSYIFGQ